MSEQIQETAQEWIFTFGFAHESPEHGPLRNRFVRIWGTFEEARREMHRRYGNTWGFQYASEDDAGVTKWGLREIEP